MCRFIAYLGKPIIVDELVLKPKNSLIMQSAQAQETKHPVNADGFGIGWYDHRIDEKPAVFKSTRPAWNNQNLINLAGKIYSDCFFAHVRAASIGRLAESNCHPFLHDKLMFMHNGLLECFEDIKRIVRHEFSDEVYRQLHGQTDSEHLFGLFYDYYMTSKNVNVLEGFYDAFVKTLEFVLKACAQKNLEGLCLLNFVISDGRHLMATRYSQKPSEEINSLYYSYGHDLQFRDGLPEMICGDGHKQSVIIASERLTKSEADWYEVPVNHVVLVNEKLDITLKPIELLSS